MMNNAAVINRRTLSSAMAGVCMMFGISTAMAAPPATVEGTYGTITIGDFPGMLDRVGTLANKVKPGLSGELIRGQLGMLLGDEGLKSLAPGSGLVVTVPQTGRPFLLLETADGKAQAIADLLKGKGLMAEKISEKLVAAATDEASINNAKGAMGTAAAAKLEGNDDQFLLATVDADKLIQDKGPQLQDLLKKLQQKAAESGDSSSTGSAKMLSFVGGMVTAIAKRTDVATIKIDLSGDGVHFEKTLYPIGGVKVDEPTGPTGQELSKALPAPENATMRYDSYIDTQTAFKAMLPIISEGLESAGVAGDAMPELAELLNLASQAFGDGFAGWISFGEQENGFYLISVQDQEKAIQYMERGISSVTTGGLAGLYKGLGLETSATLTRNVATIEGQPAHRLSMKITGEGLEANPFMKMYDMENAMFTFIDNNKILIAIDGTKLEEAVKAVKAGTADSPELKSRAELPQGGDMYIDYNLAFLGDAVAKDSPEMAEFFTGLSDNPILEAAYIDQESIKLMMVIPDEMITNAAKNFEAFAKKQAEKMQETGEDSPATGTETDSETTTETE